MQTVMKSRPELHWGRSSGSPRFMSRSEANSKFPKAQLLYYTGLCNVNMFGINFHRRLHPFPALSPLPPSSSISALCWRSAMTLLRQPEGLALVIAARYPSDYTPLGKFSERNGDNGFEIGLSSVLLTELNSLHSPEPSPRPQKVQSKLSASFRFVCPISPQIHPSRLKIHPRRGFFN